MTIHSYQARSIDSDREVWVYRNLLRAGVWYSVMQRTHVVAHADEIVLAEVRFVGARRRSAPRGLGRSERTRVRGGPMARRR